MITGAKTTITTHPLAHPSKFYVNEDDVDKDDVNEDDVNEADTDGDDADKDGADTEKEGEEETISALRFERESAR